MSWNTPRGAQSHRTALGWRMDMTRRCIRTEIDRVLEYAEGGTTVNRQPHLTALGWRMELETWSNSLGKAVMHSTLGSGPVCSEDWEAIRRGRKRNMEKPLPLGPKHGELWPSLSTQSALDRWVSASETTKIAVYQAITGAAGLLPY